MMVLHGGVVAAGKSQSAVSKMFCGVGLWKRMPRLPPHPHESAGLFVFFSILVASMFNSKEIFFYHPRTHFCELYFNALLSDF